MRCLLSVTFTIGLAASFSGVWIPSSLAASAPPDTDAVPSQLATNETNADSDLTLVLDVASPTAMVAQSNVLESTTAPAWTVDTAPAGANAPTSTIEAAPENAPQWTEMDAAAPNSNLATTAPIPSPVELEALQTQLENFAPAPQRWSRRYKASPGITLGIPSGFGADRGIFTGAGIQRTRADSIDGAAGFGIGFGNARTAIGVQLSYTAYALSPNVGSDRPFGAGGLNIKLHRQFPNGWSAAIGADSVINFGGSLSRDPFNRFNNNEAEGTYYGAVTKLVKLKPDATESFSRLAVTVGAGTGRFQPVQSIREGRSVITPFASAALKISPAASVIAEWSGQDFGIGLSWVPFRNLPIVITPAIRDLFGPDAERPRWQLGVGLSISSLFSP